MKKKIIIIGSLIIIVIGLVSLYNTFAIDKDNSNDNDNKDGINLTLKESDMNVTINSGEEKYIDMYLQNTYDEGVKYGIYYQMNEPKSIPSGLEILIDDKSDNNNLGLLKPLEEKIVTIKMVNNSSYNVSLTLGSVVGFVQGDINSLLEKNMILIK